jgi:hypothetical protein
MVWTDFDIIMEAPSITVLAMIEVVWEQNEYRFQLSSARGSRATT